VEIAASIGIIVLAFFFVLVVVPILLKSIIHVRVFVVDLTRYLRDRV